MMDCCDRMVKKHPGSAVSHNGADAFPHFRCVTMYRARGTEGPAFEKRALVAPLQGIVCKFLALRA